MITKHKTTLKALSLMLPNLYYDCYNADELFDPKKDRHLTARERRVRMNLIKKAKLECERNLKLLEQQYDVALYDVAEKRK